MAYWIISNFLLLGDGAFDTIEELVADGLISLYMEEHNVEQYINRQIFRRKTCKRNSRLKHIASARRALAKYKDNKANGKSIITYMYTMYVYSIYTYTHTHTHTHTHKNTHVHTHNM